MLKHRLFFGTMMTVVLVGLMLFDGWLDTAIDFPIAAGQVSGTLLCLVITVLAGLAQVELSRLAANVNLKIFKPITIPVTILLATSWYWGKFTQVTGSEIIIFVGAIGILAIFLYQGFRCGIAGTIGNCGASCLSILYLGLLSSFVMLIRLDFGLWALLMFVFTIKSADIGAYTAGSLFGRHKFSPRISPGKTWEGMAGAVILAGIVGSIFAGTTDIMSVKAGAVFGVVFAFIGQLGDLAESMLKRDAEQKDSSNNVPGFGGILDIIDSPLVAAMPAGLFMRLLS